MEEHVDARDLLINIDWELLSHQKQALIEIREDFMKGKSYNALSGVINLLDFLQDFAHDRLGIPVVFLTDDEEKENGMG